MKYKVAELPFIDGIEKIYFVGIKGVGMAPLAMIANDSKLIVKGSDLGDQFITDKYLEEKGIQIDTSFDETSISSFFSDAPKEVCLCVTTGAHKGFDNPQVKWAKENDITVLTQGQALAMFMRGEIVTDRELFGISIAGSHGKTTVSSLLATTMKALGMEPSYSVGTGELFPLAAPGHLGTGPYFVAEADEYASEPVYDRIPKFLYQTPKYAIFNNIDFDHPDLFESIDDVVTAFLELAFNIQSGGILFINGDDPRLRHIEEKLGKDVRVVSFGRGEENDYILTKAVETGLNQRFTVLKKGVELGVFELSLHGAHNALNSLGVIAFLSEIGYEAYKIRACLKVMTGTKRRCEIVGKTQNGALLIDDYGHHPLEIATTLNAIKGTFPDKKIVVVFQPHTYSRTKALLGDFAKAFEKADQLLLLPIFKSMRDTENDAISTDEYLAPFQEKGEINYQENAGDMVEYISKKYDSSEYLIVTMGAGDVYKIAYQLKHV